MIVGMRWPLVAVLQLASSGAPLAAQNAAPDVAMASDLAAAAQQAVFVRVDAGRAARYVGETATVRVTIGFDRAFFAKHGAPLFQRDLDLPVQLAARWLDGADDCLRSQDREPPPSTAMLRLVVNDRVVSVPIVGDETVAARTFAIVTFERRFVLPRPGSVALSVPTLRFAVTTAFREDFVNGRTPTDRLDCEVRATFAGEPSPWSVRPLPTEGRPTSFAGAVGTFTIAATSLATAVKVGQSFEVDVQIRGDGDLRALASPPLRLPGFHTLGVLDRGGDGVRTFRCELQAETVDVSAVPPIELVTFDPLRARFEVVATSPLPLVVRPAATPDSRPESVHVPPLTAAVVLEDIAAGNALPRDSVRPGNGAVLAMLVVPWFLITAAALVARRRSRAQPLPRDPGALVAAFALAADRRDPDLLQHFERYLEARLRCGVLTSTPDELLQHLQRCSIDGDLAYRAQKLRSSLVAARYAGLSESLAVIAAQVVLDLERGFADQGERR